MGPGSVSHLAVFFDTAAVQADGRGFKRHSFRIKNYRGVTATEKIVSLLRHNTSTQLPNKSWRERNLNETQGCLCVVVSRGDWPCCCVFGERAARATATAIDAGHGRVAIASNLLHARGIQLPTEADDLHRWWPGRPSFGTAARNARFDERRSVPDHRRN